MIKEFLKKSQILKNLYRYYTLKSCQPSWKLLLRKDKNFWKSKLIASKNGPKVLIATSTGAHLPGTILESAIAVALTLRGADVHILLCDSVLPACLIATVASCPNQKQFAYYGPSKDLCIGCFSSAYAMYNSLGIVVHRYSDFLSVEEYQKADSISSTTPFNEIEKFTLDKIPIGEHIMAGTLRFFARGTLEGEYYAKDILRRYFKAALLTAYSTNKLLEKYNFECVVLHHGIYIPQGIISEVSRKEKVRVVTWNPAYRKKCFIFSHNDSYHHTMMTEPVSRWENIEWTQEMENELIKYLKSRWKGTRDWIWFHENPKEDMDVITNELGINFSKPCIGMLTNVIWDAQLHYPANAFSNMIEWTLQTINYFIKRPELQLLIRVHPAEIRGTIPSRQRIIDEIKKLYPILPKNIFIIPPESQISTYAVMLKCDSVIIYGTKTGVELTSIGIPVIVAGEAWIRNKGVTMDVNSMKDYFNLLDRLPINKRMDDLLIKRARMYAYHFFFRRMIPLEFMKQNGKNSPYRLHLTTLRDLEISKDKGLDIICDGILKGSDFIYPYEEYQ
ncbi:MAG: capsule biosynthesis protein [Actinobacteria bacterium]|nr:capsule biosynthesis protein [Actinomycetota bacterium]